MASTLTRRPLPALISLIALLLLTGLVWWRVLHRGGDGSAGAAHCPTSSTSAPPTAQALPAPAQVTVLVLNSTTRAGIAAKARTALIDAGFSSPSAATNDRSRVRVRGVAEIRYGPTGEKAARLLSFYFPGAKLAPNQTSKTATVVVSLGERYTKVATAQVVKDALASAHLATASPSPTPSGSASC